MKRLFYAVPVLIFAVLAFVMFRSLSHSDAIPSAFINKPAPHIALPPIDDETPGFTAADLSRGQVTVVNFFASWCVPCRAESPQLMALAKIAAPGSGVQIFGVDYEERQPGAGRAFLNTYGNPFSRIVADEKGSGGMEWGVYGVPETYVVDGTGIIRFKLVGPLTDAALQDQVLPAIEKAKKATQ